MYRTGTETVDVTGVPTPARFSGRLSREIIFNPRQISKGFTTHAAVHNVCANVSEQRRVRSHPPPRSCERRPASELNMSTRAYYFHNLPYERVERSYQLCANVANAALPPSAFLTCSRRSNRVTVCNLCMFSRGIAIVYDVFDSIAVYRRERAAARAGFFNK